MRRIRGLFSRLLDLFSRRRSDTEIDAELQFHLDFHIRESLASGMSPVQEEIGAASLVAAKEVGT